MRVVVTGGRFYSDKKALWDALDKLHYSLDGPITLLGHGACAIGDGGADIIAEQWAKHQEVVYIGIPAKFHTGTRGSAEGPLRNQKMLDTVKPDVVLAVSGGKGTANCVKEAEQRNIKVIFGDLWNE